MSVEKRYRQLLVISGELVSCQAYAKNLSRDLQCLELDDLCTASSYLGMEFDAVIFNTFESFNPNALGIISGTIRAGGYLILLKPLSWGTESLFLQRFERLLANSKNIRYLDLSKTADILGVPQPIKIDSDYATKDQQKAVDAIVKVVKGHRRRPLVITADRGRGKSAALGLASALLLKDSIDNIIITAPNKKMAEVIFKHAKNRFPQARLLFFSPDELQQKKPKAGLVLVDEAGAIPIPLLECFVKHYSRIVFATTLHGYEGCGRGFTLKFFKALNGLTPQWKHCQLETPVRYPKNDPLEQFIFKSLLLNAEPAKAEFIKQTKLADCHVELLDKQALLNDEVLLKSVFGLLVNAHYQTKPSDLKLLLDDTALNIQVLFTEQRQVIAVALLIKEGAIEAKLASQIFNGQRRIKGHLVAQALAANAGSEFAPCLMGERVSRIAVHPQLQNKGFGSYLLTSVCNRSKAEYVSTSYGVSLELLNFWNKQGFDSVYLSMKRDASSGMHSLIMLKGLTNKGLALVEASQLRFAKNYVLLLAEPFKKLETELALLVLADLNTDGFIELSKSEEKEVAAFGYQQRGYENSLHPIWKFTIKTLPEGQSRLTTMENKVLMLKVLQKNSWQATKDQAGLSGKKDVLKVLRQAVSRLISKK